MKNFVKWLLLLILRVLATGLIGLSGCGGSSQSASSTPPIVIASHSVEVSLAHVGDPFVYANGSWLLPAGQTNVGAWVVHGTIETPAFGPAGWDQDSHGLQNAVSWWTDTNTPNGLQISASTPANGLYNASLINAGVVGEVFIRQQPVIDIAYSVTAMSGRARATVGVSMVDPNGASQFVEQELEGGFGLCIDRTYDRCTSNVVYFPPTAPGPIDVRALLLRSPNMTAAKADSLRIIGIYVGSEIFGSGQLDLLISNFSLTAQIP